MRKKLQPCKTPSITPTPTRRPEPAFVAGSPAWMNGPQAHLSGRTKHRGPLLGRLFLISAEYFAMSRRRVVVTGLGCVSPVGNTVAEAWSNLLAGAPALV